MSNDIRWNKITHHVAPEAWHQVPGRGRIVVVDCGKGLPPAIGNLVKIFTADGERSCVTTWRVRGIEQAGGREVGLLVTEATQQEIAEACAASKAEAREGEVRDAVRTLGHLSDAQRLEVLTRILSGGISADRVSEVAAKLREAFGTREDRKLWTIVEEALALLGQPVEG